jgi:hypothetical protein
MVKNVVFCLAMICTPAHASTTLWNWVAGNADPAEPVVCQREVNGEYFFVARARDNDKVRVGSRVDLTGYRETLSWSVSWRLRNENSKYITPKIVPSTIRQELVRAEEKIYFESVQHHTINVGASKRLRVAVAIEKCAIRPCSGQSSTKYTVTICETQL